MIIQALPSSKQRARKDTEEARQRIAAILTSLNPRYANRGILFDVPLSGSDQALPLPLRGNRLLLRSYVANQYEGTMPLSSFNYALSELVTRLKSEHDQAKPIQPTLFEKERVQGHTNLYIVPGVGICMVHADREGNETITHVWDTLPIVHTRYVVPTALSGYETQYDLQIGNDRAIVSIDELKRGNWISKYPGVSGVLSSSKHGQYIDAISQIAIKSPIKHGYEATGWYNIGDENKPEWVYLLHDGRYISSDGSVHAANTGNVELRKQLLTDGELSLWSTYQVPVTSTVEAHKEALSFLTQLTSKYQALLLLGHAAIAMLYDVRNGSYGTSHSLALVGKPGSGKTSLAAFSRCLVYPYKRKPFSDATYEDTLAAIEFNLADRKSVPIIVDDLPERDYSSQGKKQEYINKADSLIRATYNESPVKKRMTSKLQHQKANIVATLPIHTWEVVPDVGISCLRRVLILTLDDGEIATDTTPATPTALDQIHQHVAAIHNIGYRLAVFTAKMLEKHGKDGLASKLFIKQAEYEKRIRASIIEKWANLRDGEKIPDTWASIAEIASYELVGLWLVDQVTLFDSNLVELVYDSLVDAVYCNVLRMAGTSVDEAGFTPIELALQSVFTTIADNQAHNGSTWVVEQYTTKAETVKPTAIRPDGNKIPYTQWGKATHSDNTLTIAYIDEQVTYLTRHFREAFKSEYNQLPGVKPLTSDKAITQLLDNSGWLVRANSKQATKDITPHSIRLYGVLSVPNTKLFKLLGIDRLEPTPDTPKAIIEAEAIVATMTDPFSD